MTGPTDEEAALYVMSIFLDHFHCRAGDVLRVNNFLSFGVGEWRGSDLTRGLKHAVSLGWIEVQPGGISFKLTQEGCDGASAMNLLSTCNEDVTVERSDGTRYENVRALVSAKMILVPDVKIPIAVGDAILRQLPSHIVQRFVVTDPGYYASIHGMPAHYQVKYRVEGQEPAGKAGYVFHISGNNARVNLNSTDNSTNSVTIAPADLSAIASELEQLRAALLSRASSPEHYVAIGSVAAAEVAAKEGDSSRLGQALRGLGNAGKWVFETAKEIGIKITAEVIKGAAGLAPGS